MSGMQRTFIVGGTSLTAAIFAVDILLPSGFATNLLYTLLVLVGWLAPWPGTIFIMAAAATVLSLVGSITAPEAGEAWVAVFNQSLQISVIWAVAIFCFQRKRAEAEWRGVQDELERWTSDAPGDLETASEKLRPEGSGRTPAEETLQESEARFRELTEHMQEVFWIANADGEQIIYVSPAYEEVWRRSRKSVYEDPRNWLEVVHPDDRSRVRKAFYSRVPDLEFEEEYRILRPGNFVRWIRHRGFPVRDENGVIYRVAGIAEDITDRKLAELALLETRDELDLRVRERTSESRAAVEQLLAEIEERKQAEVARRASEARYRALFEESRDAIYITTREGRFIAVNQAQLDLFGYTREEMLELDVSDNYADPEDRMKFQREIELRGSVKDYEVKMLRKDGTVIDALLTGTVRRDSEGGVLGYQGIIRDVSELKRSLEALRESEERYRGLFEESRDPITMATRDARFVDVNRAALDLFGYTEQEMLGLSSVELYANPEDRRLFQQEIERQGFVKDHEVTLQKKDGTEITCLFSATVRRGSDGSILGYQGIISDITERKRVEKSLRESEGKYRSLVEQNLDGIYLIQDERYKFGNQTYLDMLGYTREELLDLDPWDVVAPESTERVRERVRRRRQGEVLPGTYELKFVRKDGSLLDVETNVKEITYEGRHAMQGCVRDISERKRGEKEMVKLERIRALGEMAAGVSHNLNNILMGILGPCEILQLLDLEPEILKETQTIHRSGMRARELVKRLSQAVRSGDETQTEPTHIGKMVEDAIQSTRPKWKDEAEARGISIEVTTDLKDMSPVNATQFELHDILINLLLNAVDAMPEGGRITLQTRVVSQGVQLKVIDTGTGMDDEMVRDFLSGLLSEEHDVEAVHSGLEALNRFRARDFDVVLVDLSLPEMSGDELVQRIRVEDPLITTVLITGWEIDEVKSRTTGFDFTLQKPLTPLVKVKDVVAHAIELHRERVRANGGQLTR